MRCSGGQDDPDGRFVGADLLSSLDLLTPAPAGSLELAMTHPEFYWYVDEGLSAENLKSSLLRSEILFGAPLPNYYSVDDRWEEQRAKFQSFVVTYVAMLAKQSTR